jgi:putative transposase
MPGVRAMPRKPRRASDTRTYHIMLRGNEKKSIFLDDEDKSKMIDTMFKVKDPNSFLLYAYCIMDNHAHAVIREKEDTITRIMSRIATSYAFYFNDKYNRVGHVFQDRYRSECIENDNYLLAAVRYIHNNPQKAGICDEMSYRWSSIKHYLHFGKHGSKLPEVWDVLSIFSEEPVKAIAAFRDFCAQKSVQVFMDIDEDNAYDIDQKNATDFIRRFVEAHGITLEELKLRSSKKIRDDLIRKLHKGSKLSNRQIASLLDISRETVRKVQ